jgi:hypothetical protein
VNVGSVSGLGLGQKRKCPGSRGTSGLPSGADILSLPRHVRLVPSTDIVLIAIPGGTRIGVVRGDIDKVLLAEAPFGVDA